jgi:hypothetical protein
MEQAPFLNADSSSASQKISRFYGTQIPLPCSKQFAICHYRKPVASNPSSCIFILNLFSNYLPHLLVVLPSVLFPSALPTKTLYASLLSPQHVPTIPYLNPITWIKLCKQNKSLIFSLWNYLQSSVAPSISNGNKTPHCTEQNDSPRTQSV